MLNFSDKKKCWHFWKMDSFSNTLNRYTKWNFATVRGPSPPPPKKSWRRHWLDGLLFSTLFSWLVGIFSFILNKFALSTRISTWNLNNAARLFSRFMRLCEVHIYLWNPMGLKSKSIFKRRMELKYQWDLLDLL